MPVQKGSGMGCAGSMEYYGEFGQWSTATTCDPLSLGWVFQEVQG